MGIRCDRPSDMYLDTKRAYNLVRKEIFYTTVKVYVHLS